MANDIVEVTQSRLNALDAASITPVVRNVLGLDDLQVLDWSYTQIHGGTGGGGGGTFVYRFAGHAATHDTVLPWSVILKIVSAKPQESLVSTHYWKREFEAYASGLLDDLPPGLRAARCYGVLEYAGEACWIWQEAIEDAIGASWEIEQYRLSARHAGAFNSAYLMGRPLPDYPWLSRGWLRENEREVAPHVDEIVEMLRSLDWRYGTLDASEAETQFLRLWSDRERFLNALDRLPQTLAHQDAVRANLFLVPEPNGALRTVAIDWAFVGIAPIGMEIAVPLTINLLFVWVASAKASALQDALYSGYLEGLREQGWTGDARLVRFGMAASAACKFLEALMLNARYELGNQSQSATWEGLMGRPYAEILAAFEQVFRLVCLLADEARALLVELELES